MNSEVRLRSVILVGIWLLSEIYLRNARHYDATAQLCTIEIFFRELPANVVDDLSVQLVIV